MHSSDASWKVPESSGIYFPLFKGPEGSGNECRFWKVLEILCQGSEKFLNCLRFKFHEFALRFVMCSVKELKGSVKEPNISIYFFFLPITPWCSISDVLFNGGRGVSDFSVLKYYKSNSVNILNECLRILIDCSQLSKTYYNVLFGSFTRHRHARRIYRRTFRE